MEVTRNEFDKLEKRVGKIEDKQNEMYADIKVTKEVVLQLKESWNDFDKTRKDNFNKLSMQVIFIIISGVVGSIIGFITRGGK